MMEYPLRQQSLKAYRDLLQSFSIPTDEQMAAFAGHVATMHSWYKHLPLTQPGHRFTFYLDPCAGMERSVSTDGRISFQEIMEADCFVHHSMIPTQEYRRRFGILAVVEGGVPTIEVEGERQMVPAEIATAGAMELTGVMHPASAQDFVWRRYFDSEKTPFPKHYDRLHWPEESGGAVVLDGLMKLLREGRQDRETIDAFISPERRRLRKMMVARMKCLVEFVVDPPG
ncbi:MAG TPA: hypothetical protein VMP01_22185 [Pirellulaceae bacterium]|nr:hypothetical protein [Pirellulaceae bacterium]